MRVEICVWRIATMQNKSLLAAMFVLVMIGTIARSQVQPPQAPWRGAGPTPCVGSDGGYLQCPPAPQTFAIRAGRLFDSKAARMLTKQVVVIQGERISEIGAEGQVKIPAGAEVIDLSQATGLPLLGD